MNGLLKILLLEDSKIDAEIIQRMLLKQEMHCEFHLAMTQKNFLRALEEFSPDLILSDNSLPGFNATEALTITRQRFLHIPFILVTGTVSEEYAADIIKSGADDYILKDRMARLPAAIEASLKKRRAEKEIADYRYALDQSAIVAITDQKGIIIYANENFCKISKYSSEELIGQDHRIINSGYHDASFIRYLWVTIANGKIWRGEFRNKAKDGSFYWVDTTIVPFLNEKGKPYQYLSIRVDVTEKKKAEQELLQTQMRLKQAQAISHLGNWELNFETNTPKWSDEAYRIYGLKPGDNLTMDKWVSFVHPDDKETVKQKIQKSQAELSDLNMTLKIIRKDKAERHVYSETKYEFNKEGRPIGMYGIVHDITENKKAEEDLRRSEMRLKEAQTLGHMGNWEIDLTQNTHTWSDEFYRIYGITKGEVQPSAELFLSLMHSDDAEFAQNKVQKAFDALKDSSFNFRFIRKDGAIRHGYTEWRFEFDKKGKPIRLFGIMQDITQRKEAEEELSRNELRFRTLTSNAPVGIFQTDAAGKTIYVNEAWLEYTGLTFDEAMGEGWHKVLHPEDKNKQLKQWEDKSQSALESSSEFRLLDKTGNIRWVTGRATPMFDKSHSITGYIGTLSDITERKKLEQELLDQQRNEQLKITATALEAQEKERTLLGQELHDNVNQIIVGSKLLLSMVKNSPEKAQELVNTCIDHLQQAIEENRKLSHKLVTPDLETDSLVKQISDLTHSMLETTGTKINIEAKHFREELLGDQQKIAVYRIAQEQCTNIIKYARASHVTISLRTGDGVFRMLISDDGQGMEEGKTTKGIGLRNITGRVSVFNGKAEIRTEPGKGFTLDIEMPVK